MFKSFKTFIFTFIVAPSILGLGVAFALDVFPFLWSLITQKNASLAFKDFGLNFSFRLCSISNLYYFQSHRT
ncbi:hypothetical protein CHH64_00015 [Terribacillus saccharophilus]|uniref:Uncharacterized protein n=1 Tax=Terribacillus saccharophilus TaxID=361277 RepID=A0A268AFZ7_9BACI|nr:hypothetical protein CHH64_00015 [Terribacillus saccharophilus]